MSIDLEWSKLDSTLSHALVNALSRQLSTTTRPSFIGPIEVTSIEFGTTAPDIELVDLRDIYRDFLEDDEDDEKEAVKVTEGVEDDDGFEWVSRRAARREEGLAFQQLPHFGRGGPMNTFASTPTLHSPVIDTWNPALSSLVDYRPSYASWSSPGASPFRRTVSSNPIPSNIAIPIPPYLGFDQNTSQTGPPSSLNNSSLPNQPESSVSISPPPPPVNNHPNLQLHLHINWHSDLRITLTTSLLINYPSPMFMSLPIKLSVTGLIFTGELTVAYEGERGRVHLCILDDLDPYGPATERPKRDSQTLNASVTPEDEPESINPPRPTKPLPIGQRLLPSIFIESEIGQADKHVLKNVNRVERFIQDVIRKAVEEELVFPNFHTLVLSGSEGG
ncbi:mitochondrial distribution and morphology protein 12 [Lentinula aciculospora]|uniref:Mitochondrial distribution and morphology protein 12 n=1 Tax=Lentinula aciculospora TaxID=153920 RepID=A0A9W9DN67_9AGAR|nr:mitochondrial distribution and morphology protein 12 [Lentinula aciculospora]